MSRLSRLSESSTLLLKYSGVFIPEIPCITDTLGMLRALRLCGPTGFTLAGFTKSLGPLPNFEPPLALPRGLPCGRPLPLVDPLPLEAEGLFLAFLMPTWSFHNPVEGS